ncbi:MULTISPECIES: SEL1-like repeat-containing protein kinase family protein [Sphingobacterium]|uniref:SEL1-like repeat-containing protein kinase family protein n=1 Tax=Sphingobacterium TaxID=28453 RepID=UPI00257AD30B|nr:MULTISPECIES: protein kinase [Sphingobacterium]
MQFQDRYKYNPQTDLLGKGGFARVYRATDTLLDRIVAVKVFNTADSGHYTVLEEIKKVINYDHPNLLRYYDVAILENTNAFGEKEVLQVGIMEYANAGDLKSFAQKNPDSPILFQLLQQVLNGLYFLHNKGIIHRDLKPQNILLKEENGILTAKISDFGISRLIDSQTNSASLTIGTIEYMAPEQFSPNKYGIEGKISANVDLWSFGIMVHELITNKPPFGHRSGDTTAEQIMSSILSADLPKEVDNIREPYQSVIKKCLVADAKQRIKTATELIQYFDVANRNDLETQVLDLPSKLHPKETANEQIADRSEKAALQETRILENLSLNEEKEDSTKRPLAAKPTGSTENEVNDPTSLSNTAKKRIRARRKGIIVAVIACAVIALIVLKYVGFKATAPRESPEAKFYVNVQRLYNEHKPDSILQVLKDSANLQLANVSGKAVRYYTLALIEKADTAAAVPYLIKTQEMDLNEFSYLMGELYYVGKYVKQDYKKAKILFESTQNDPRSLAMLGHIYFMGLDVAKDYPKAIQYYERAVQGENTVAMYALGYAYATGEGVPKDFEAAKKLLNDVIRIHDNYNLVEAAQNILFEYDPRAAATP